MAILCYQITTGFDSFSAMFGGALAVLAAICGWVAPRIHLPETRKRIKLALLGGFILGSIGFVGGFFGPIIFVPETNQGPLLGIFITGPLGFILGTIGTGLYACFHIRRKD